MSAYAIEITEEARHDLSMYTAFERKIITTAIRDQLAYQPLLETANRKKLRDNPIADWELRIGRFRVFYEVEEAEPTVVVIAVGHKVHNVLFIRGEEVEL